MSKRIQLTLPDNLFQEIEKQSKNALSNQETIRKMLEKAIKEKF